MSPRLDAKLLPKWPALLFLFGVFFLPFSKSLAEIGFIGSLFLAAKDLIFTSSRPKWPEASLLAFVLAFFIWVLLSAFFSSHSLTLDVWRGVLKWAKYLLVGLFAFQISSNQPSFSRLLLKVLAFSSSLVCLNGFCQMITGSDWIKGYHIDYPSRFARMQSSLGAPNDLAAYLLVTLPILFYIWHEKKNWSFSALGWVVCLALHSVALVLTFSRAAFMAWILSLSLLMIWKKKWFFILVGALCLWLFIGSSSIAKDNFMTSLHLKNKTVQERLIIWKSTLEIIRKHPLVGTGPNTYFHELQRQLPKNIQFKGYAHNSYLQLASEIGLPGLLFLMIILTMPFVQYWLRGGKASLLGLADCLFLGISAFVIHATFDTHFFSLQLSYLFWAIWRVYLSQIKNPRGFKVPRVQY